MRLKNRTFIFLALAILACLQDHNAIAANAAKDQPASPVIPVSITKAQRHDVPLYIEGLGTIQAYNTVTIRSQVDGQLTEIVFKEGMDVRAGEVLARIDPRPFQAALDQALAKKAQNQAQLTNAMTDVERYTALAKDKFVARQHLDTARAQVAQLQAAVQGDQAAIENARILLGYTTIKSPIDGRVGIRQVDHGNILRANDTSGIVTITQVRPISVVFTMPGKWVPRIAKAKATSPLEVAVLSHESKQQLDIGVLDLMDNRIDTTSGTIRLKATLPNAKEMLWPGQFVHARLLLETLNQVITIPMETIQRGPKGSFVYGVKDDNTVEIKPVTLGESSLGSIVVLEGIKEGERVVISGQNRLQSGSRVEIKGANPTP